MDQPFMPSLVFLLCHFSEFANYMINHFISPWNLFLYISLVFTWMQIVIMALFWATIKKDLVYRFEFPFLGHVQVISCVIFLVCHLKYPYSCFPTHFCFLDFLILLLILKLFRFISLLLATVVFLCSIIYISQIFELLHLHNLQCWWE